MAGYLLTRSGFDGLLYTLLTHDVDDVTARQAFDERVDLALHLRIRLEAGIGAT